MKTKQSVFYGIAAVVMAAIFTMAGCDTEADGGDTPAAYTGGFTMNSGIVGQGDVLLELDNTGRSESLAAGSVYGSITGRFRGADGVYAAAAQGGAITATAITGRFRDADGVYEAWGSYDPVTGDFTFSADGSATRRYSVSGNFGPNGSVVASATVLNKDDEFKADAFTVTRRNAQQIVKENILKEGFPRDFWGVWAGGSDKPSDFDLDSLDSDNEVKGTKKGQTVEHRAMLVIGPFAGKANEIKTKTFYDGSREKYGLYTQTADVIFTVAEIDESSKSDSFLFVLSYPDYSGTPEQIDEAFKKYLDSEGLFATRVTFENGEPKWEINDKIQYAIEPGNSSHIEKYNWSHGEQYRAFVENYVRDNLDVVPVTMYEKILVTISDNEMTVYVYADNKGDCIKDSLKEAEETLTELVDEPLLPVLHRY
jgi:hypothetical protein